MGRKSKEHKTLTKEPIPFFLKKETVQKTMKVANTLIASAIKSKGARRVSYLDELRTVVSNLAITSYHYDNNVKYTNQLENQIEKKETKESNTEEITRLEMYVQDLKNQNKKLNKEISQERDRGDEMLKDIMALQKEKNELVQKVKNNVFLNKKDKECTPGS